MPVAESLPLTALLGGPSVTELLLRRSPPLLLRSARYDRVEACLLHAAWAAVVTLGWGEHDCGRGAVVAVCSSGCAGAVLTCDGRVKATAAAIVERGARGAILCVWA